MDPGLARQEAPSRPAVLSAPLHVTVVSELGAKPSRRVPGGEVASWWLVADG